jgi:hypothetical protein
MFPLSLKMKDFANFRRDKSKWVGQQDQQVDQCKKQIKFHHFLLSHSPFMTGKTRTRNHCISSLANALGLCVQVTGGIELVDAPS